MPGQQANPDPALVGARDGGRHRPGGDLGERGGDDDHLSPTLRRTRPRGAGGHALDRLGREAPGGRREQLPERVLAGTSSARGLSFPSWDGGGGGGRARRHETRPPRTGSFLLADSVAPPSGRSPSAWRRLRRRPAAQSRGTCSGRGLHAISASRCLSDPVCFLTGALIHEVDELAAPGTGVSPSPGAAPTPRSIPQPERPPPGPGLDAHVRGLAAGAGIGDVLARRGGTEVAYGRQADGSYVGDPGARATLTAVRRGLRASAHDQVVYPFDATGRLLAIEDRTSRGDARVRRPGPAARSRTPQAGVTISYDGSSLVSAVRAHDGRSVSYVYIRTTHLGQRRSRQGLVVHLRRWWQAATVVDPLSHAQVTNVYGAAGRVQAQTDAVGKTTDFAWDAGTEIATVTDAKGNAWRHDYDQGVLAKEITRTLARHRARPRRRADRLRHLADREGPRMTYDAAGNLVTATRRPPSGARRRRSPTTLATTRPSMTDARSKVTSAAPTTPPGTPPPSARTASAVASYTYDAAGRASHLHGREREATTYRVLSVTGYLASVTDPLGNRTTYTYDGAGSVATRVDPKGNVAGCGCATQFTWSYSYNAAGQQLTETDPLGHTTTSAYDDAGRLTSSTDANGHTTSYTYDDANRILTETGPDPDGGGPLAAPVTTYTYDDVGNKLTETDPRGSTATFAYDAANRLPSRPAPDPDGGRAATRAGHDVHVRPEREPRLDRRAARQRRRCKRGRSRTTSTYDAAGRLLTTTDPLGAATTNAYDPVGNLVSSGTRTTTPPHTRTTRPGASSPSPLPTAE